MSAQDTERARAQIAIGKSSKVDVLSALGKAAAVVSFDSGYEVWLYRIRSVDDKAGERDAEWVMLFAPSGALAKTRMRSPMPSG